MFPNHDRAECLKLALEKLAKVPDNRTLWLHDYDERCYRENKSYTRNGLHWGYPEGVVKSVLKDTSGYPFTYASFVTRTEESKTCSRNSRFTRVPYGEVREIIELGIRQDLEAAQKDAKKEVRKRKKWLQKVKEEYADLLPAAAHLGVHEGKLRVLILDPDRMVLQGFGFFLRNIKEGDVSCTPEARILLSEIPARGGLNAATFFKGPIISGCGFKGVRTDFAVEHLSVLSGALQDLDKVVTITS